MEIARLLSELGIAATARGRDFWAPCPLPDHADNDPSWHVSDDTGVWYCFGCARGGGPAQLVRRCLGIEFDAARAWLREHRFEERGGPVPEGLGVSILPSIFGGHAAFVMPPGVSFRPFEDWPKPFRDFVFKRRIDLWQIDRWRLGYAVDGRLGGRVVFPIEDERERLGSYTARTVCGDRRRYLTPDREESPSPGAVFGARYWPSPAERSYGTVVLTEGAINALACEKAGSMYVAALGGSNPHPLQIAKIARFGRIIVASDPDSAGMRVARQISALSRWCKVARAEIPKGKDAADLTTEELRTCLGESLESVAC